jgi:hypothetical protein
VSLIETVKNATDLPAKRRAVRMMHLVSSFDVLQPTRRSRMILFAGVAGIAACALYIAAQVAGIIHPKVPPILIAALPLAFAGGLVGWISAPYANESEYYSDLLAEYDPVDTVAYNKLIEIAALVHEVPRAKFIDWTNTEMTAIVAQTETATVASGPGPNLSRLLTKKR